MSDKINETAAGGSVGAHSIAVRSDRLGSGEMLTRMSLKDFMHKFNSGITNRYRFRPVNLEGSVHKITESSAFPYQVDDAVSRLKSMETDGNFDDKDVITYGIEDDKGVMMKITVPLEQGEDFERVVAQSLAEVQEYKKTGKGEDKTLAELLYELKDKFTIVNAEFPTIPKDAVYNADEITEATPEDELGDDELGDLEADGDEELDDLDADGDEEDFDPDDEEIGDDFESETSSKEDLLVSVLAMLKSQNEKEIAQANAEAEQAKARQAELALKASEDEMATQEQLVSAQAEMDAEKDKEKKAKDMAELAKFNYRKKLGESEGPSSLLRDVLLELDANDTTASLRRQMPVIMQKYRIDPNDDPETQQFKRTQARNARRELRIQLQAAREREEYEDKMKDKEQQDNDNDQQSRGPQTNDRRGV
jgi:hypothetical protein